MTRPTGSRLYLTPWQEQQELAGTVFEVMANTAAATELEVDPHGWRFPLHGDGEHHLAVAQSWSGVTA